MRPTKAPDSICEPEPKRGPRTKTIPKGKLPAVWTPKFLDEADGRFGLVRAVRQRVEELEQDCGADSIQKRLLCSRAAFLSTVLESMEVRMLEAGEFSQDVGSYVQMSNGLLGLLRHLGLERRAKAVSLSEYVETKDREACA